MKKFNYKVPESAGQYIAFVEPSYDGHGNKQVSLFIIPEANNNAIGRSYGIVGEVWDCDKRLNIDSSIQVLCSSILDKLSAFNISEIVVESSGLGIGFLDCFYNITPKHILVRGLQIPIDIQRHNNR